MEIIDTRVGDQENDPPRRKGCDPLNQTMRSKMQNRRQRLNQQINKEMRMRVGAENLFKAATNRKLKEQVALELSFVNSNLQLLKEELAEINSDVEAYQNDSYMRSVPLIPLGLKETKKLDVRIPFTDYILEHYSADGDKYENEIKELTELRQSIRTPKRNEEGVELLLEYYNQLYFIENRFFPPDRNLGVYFHWYDALTGVPSIQKSVAFEKGSVLFNIAALYTQMGAKQDRTMEDGISKAIDCFESAAGAFRYLGENFSHAPSMDMSGPVLGMLGGLMLAQVQECIFEKLVLDGVEETIESCVRVAKEASVVSDMYTKVHKMMMQQTVKDYIPYSWISMVLVKSQHFKARAHHYAAIAIVGPSMNQENGYDSETLLRLFPSMYNSEKSDLEPPQSWEERMRLGKAHIRQALMLHEEALRVHDLSKQLRKIDTLKEVLKKFHSKSMHRYQSLDNEDDFFELPDAPVILSKTQQIAKPHVPDFTKVQVKDIFHNLGPLAIFNSRNQWTAPRIVEIVRGMGGYGFTVRGDSPVIVAQVDQGFAAAASGVKEGDFIIGVNDNDVKWAKHEEVVKSILASPHRIKLELVSPLDKDFLHPQDIRRKETKSPKGSSELSPSSSHQSQSPVNGSMTSDSSLERQQPPRKTHKDSQGLKGSNASKNSKAKESITSTDGGKGSTGKKKAKKPEKTSTEERKRKAVQNSPAGLY